jgi:transglutaminase-like putative cysteine protease
MNMNPRVYLGCARAVVSIGLACCAGLAAPGAAAAEFQRAPVPAWVAVQPLDLDAKPPLGQASNGVHYLLVDQQNQLEANGRSTYRRMASRALTELGVESIAHVGIEFEPSFQKITLHSLNLYRDGRTQDRLVSAKVKVLQRETELEYRIYDGAKTIDITLDDVRVGDVVEYAYSVRGSNPVFGGREYGRMDMQWRSPVHQVHRLLRVPNGREVGFRSNQGNLQPQVRKLPGAVEYVWKASDVAPVLRPSDTPRWYDPYASVEWSEFDSWASVARWAEPLYVAPENQGTALRAEVARISAGTSDEQQRVLAVLTFVQSQIRYLGVEIGPGSHAPRAPAKVLELRYGDCKDKVLLAVTMLRALGITAHPALVDTRMRGAIERLLPTPGAFNHVILRARIGDRDFWLDPTSAPQKGSLERVAQADFGRALVLDGKASGLTDIPTAQASRRRRRIEIDIDASQGFDKPAPMTVTSTYEGASADRMRSTLRNENLEELQRDYLNYYARSYPNLKQAKPLAFEDDEPGNRLVTIERYQIEALLTKSRPEGKPVIYLYAPDIKAMLRRPDETVRSAPIGVAHPDDVTVVATTLLPTERRIVASKSTVKNAAFEFESESEYSDRKLRLTYRYRSLADHVEVAAIPAYLDDLENARSKIGYTLWPSTPKPAKNGSPRLAAILGTLALACFVATIVAATRVVEGLPRLDKPPSSSRLLVATGYALLRAPLVGMFSLVGMLAAFDGGVDVLLLGWLAALALSGIWASAFNQRWLQWAEARAGDPATFGEMAMRWHLPYRRDIRPAQASV